MKKETVTSRTWLFVLTAAAALAAFLFITAHASEDIFASSDAAAGIASARIGNISERTYTGQAITPEPSVRVKQNGTYTALQKDKDYTLSYSRNINAGTAKVIITGINGYTGTVKKEFTINPAPIKTASLRYPSLEYTGQARTQTSYVTVKARVNKTAVVLEKAGNYDIVYENNTEIGTASLTVIGKGNYTGTIVKTFKIVPAAPELKSVTGTTRRFNAKWTQPAGGITGFQLQYSTARDFSADAVTTTLKNSDTLSRTIALLTAGKTYYVRVRAYKAVGERNYYSAWCRKKSVTLSINALTVKGSSSGKRTLILDNAPESAESVSFAVWSDANGQDDMVWYAAKKNDAGRWYASFNVKKHRNAGTFCVHAYSGEAYLSGQTFALDASETATEYTELAASLKEGEKRNQLILVGAEGTECTLVMLNKNDDGTWYQLLETSGNVGLNGIGEVTEWNRKTPVGVYAFTKAFGIAEDPGMSIPYVQVDDTYYWVDDVDSPYYNQFVTTKNTSWNWNSAEHIVDYPVSYQYCLALDFNKKCEWGKGSAIFLHVGTGDPTLGCIGVPLKEMKKIMQCVIKGSRIIIDEPGKLKNY